MTLREELTWRWRLLVLAFLCSLGASAVAVAVGALWLYVHPVAAVFLASLWIFLTIPALAFGIGVAADAIFWVVSQRVIFLPGVFELLERRERDAHITGRAWPRNSTRLGTLLAEISFWINPLSPVIVAAGTFLRTRKADQGAAAQFVRLVQHARAVRPFRPWGEELTAHMGTGHRHAT